MLRVLINFGNYGISVFKAIENYLDAEVIAINYLAGAEELANLLKNNSAFQDKRIDFDKDGIIINEFKIFVFSEINIYNIPLEQLKIDVVFDCNKSTKKQECQDIEKRIETIKLKGFMDNKNPLGKRKKYEKNSNKRIWKNR